MDIITGFIIGVCFTIIVIVFFGSPPKGKDVATCNSFTINPISNNKPPKKRR